jgi:ubiquitin-protein ligase
MSALNRINRELERGINAEVIKFDETQLLLEVSVNNITVEIIFTDRYPFHPPFARCAGEYINLHILSPDVWKASCRINDIIQAITTVESNL